jgi:hypothetical protein
MKDCQISSKRVGLHIERLIGLEKNIQSFVSSKEEEEKEEGNTIHTKNPII